MQTGENQEEIKSLKPFLDIEKHKGNAEIVHLTARQISKDFATFGMDITFSGNTAFAYPELMEQLSQHILWMLQVDEERLFALMYQIDINQASVHECLRLHENPAQSLADLIIRREMMKVLTVQYFKMQKSKSGK